MRDKEDPNGLVGETLGTVLKGKDGGGASLFVGVMFDPDRGGWGKIECNPARLFDEEDPARAAGCGLLPFDRARWAVERMTELAAPLLEPRCDVPDMRLRRADVARDFTGLVSPAFYVRGLANLRRKNARRQFTYNDPQNGNAETLYAGSGAGGVRLYDKHKAHGDRGAPVGSLRWEVEARRGWLGRVGMERVRDLESRALSALALSRWEWSRMGVEVTGTLTVAEQIQRMVGKGEGQISQARADRLLGMLVRDALGVAGNALGNSTTADYNRLRDRLGLVPSGELLGIVGAEVPAAGRLDFAAGLEVAA